MSKYTAFRCPNDLLRRAKRTADSERRSLSNYIIRLLEQDLVKRAARDMEYEQEEASKRLHSAAHST
jgi:chemotaxis receptor (MCP) glutamine deamidase CheD